MAPGEPVRIVDLATDLIRLSGLTAEDIPIVFTGLRPGEKLAEELWEERSQVEPVGEGDVFRVQEPDPPLSGARLEQTIAALAQAADHGDGLEVHRVLSEAIPSFVSSLAGLPNGEARAPRR